MAAHTKDDPGPTEGVAQPDDTGLPNAKWEVGGGSFTFPVEVVEEDGGNRLVFRERPFRDGVKIDSTGGKQKTWKLDCFFDDQAVAFDPEFSNSTLEDVLNGIIDSFDKQETGDLTIPTRGKRRCRANTYSRKNSFENQKGSIVSFLFVEDNEDSVDQSAVQRRTIKGSGGAVVQRAQFDSESIGLWNGSISGLLDAMNELQGILNLPNTLLDDTLANIGVLVRNIEKTIDAFKQAGVDGRDMLLDPSGSRLERRLIVLLDEINGARYEAGTNRQPKTTSIVFEVDYSMFDIAALVKQDAQKLIDLNQYRIADPLHVEAGTQVLIFS